MNITNHFKTRFNRNSSQASVLTNNGNNLNSSGAEYFAGKKDNPPLYNNFLKDTVLMLIIFAVYFTAGKLGLRLAFENASATAIWAPTGIALAAFLLRGYNVWPVILLGAFLINITTTGDIPTSFCIAFGNTAEGLLGAYLVNKYAEGKYAFEKLHNILKFVLFAGVLNTALSATIGVTSLAIRGLADWNHYISVWLTWWLGDAAGAFLVAPLLIFWFLEKKIKPDRSRLAEALCIFITLAVVSIIEFTPLSFAASKHYPFNYIIIPPFIWIAFRFSQRMVAAAAFGLCAIAIWGTLNGYGPFVVNSPTDSLLFLQAFIIILSVMSLSFAAVILERNKTEKRVSESEERFHSLFKQASVGIAQFDLAGKFVLVNERYCDIVGRPQNELLGLYIHNITHPDDLENNLILFNKLITDGKEYLIEKRYIKPDGTLVWIKKSVALIRDKDNSPKYVEGICSDITEQKIAEKHLNIQYSISKALAESSTFNEASIKVLKSICEGVGWDLAAIWLVDNDSEVLRIENSWFTQKNIKDSGMTDPRRTFQKGEGLPGRVWSINNPVWIADVMTDNNFPRTKCAVSAGLHAGFAFPVRSGNEVIAVIECFNKKILEPREDLLDVLNASGRQIGNFLDRKRAEEEKEIAQHTYQSLFESTLDGILIVDDKGTYINVNESYAKMLKGSREVLIGQPFSKFIPPDFLQDAANKFIELKEGENTGRTEFPLLALDGTLVEAEWISRANFLPGLHFCVARDISERKKSEKKLAEEYSFRKAIEDSLAAGIAAVNSEGVQTYVNPSLCNLLGWSEEELIGTKPPYVYWPPEEIENIAAAFSKTLGGTASGERFNLRFCKKNGERIDVLVIVSPIKKDDGTAAAWLASVTDITELKKVQNDLKSAHDEMEERVKERTGELNTLVEVMQKEILERKRTEEELTVIYDKLKKTQSELIHSEKLASLGRFSAGIAHEIRNPLANISALAQLLNKATLDPKLNKHIKYILINSDIANDIIKNLLSFAAPDDINFKKNDINEVINNLYNIVKTRCDKNNIHLIKRTDNRVHFVMLNEEKLQSAFLNFVSNAIDAMPGGGTLKILSDLNEITNEVVITFEDTGIGIQQENIDKILEPFFTTKNQGTGLGMSLSYQVIRAHRGKIDIHSKINAGTKISVTLPLLKDN